MKKVVFLLAVLFSATTAFAQTEDESNEDFKERSNAFFIGPKVGGVMSTMTQPEQGDLYDSWGMGFSAGVAFKARFGKATESSEGGTGAWGLGAELKFKQNTVKTLAIDESGKAGANLSLGYFEVPVYLQLYPFAKSRSMSSFYIEVGTSFAGTLSRSPKSLTLNDPSGKNSAVEFFIDKDGSQLKGMDVRPLVGIGYTFPNTGLDINARYNMGTSDLAGNFASKISSFEVSLSWMFDINP